MKKRIIVFLASLICVFLSACGGEKITGQDVIGIWKDDNTNEIILLLNEDGTGEYCGKRTVMNSGGEVSEQGIIGPITWNMNGKKLVVSDSFFGDDNFKIQSENGTIYRIETKYTGELYESDVVNYTKMTASGKAMVFGSASNDCLVYTEFIQDTDVNTNPLFGLYADNGTPNDSSDDVLVNIWIRR